MKSKIFVVKVFFVQNQFNFMPVIQPNRENLAISHTSTKFHLQFLNTQSPVQNSMVDFSAFSFHIAFE